MHMARWSVIAALATACSFDANGGSEGTSSDGGTTTTTSSSTSTTTTATSETQGDSSTAMPESSSGEPGTSSESGAPEELEHGIVKLQLRRADGERSDLFDDTVRIQITMSYESCLFDFYTAHPEYAQAGDLGAEIWGPLDAGGEGWLDRLCEVPVADLVECSVSAFEQQLEQIPALRINYTTGSDLEQKIVPFGPLPDAALAACGGGEAPTVRLANGGAIGGYDSNGEKIWEGSTFEPNSAATDDHTPIVVDCVIAN